MSLFDQDDVTGSFWFATMKSLRCDHLLFCIAALCFLWKPLSAAITEEDRIAGFHARNYTWPPAKYVPADEEIASVSYVIYAGSTGWKRMAG
jgi:hypothetical protein